MGLAAGVCNMVVSSVPSNELPPGDSWLENWEVSSNEGGFTTALLLITK